ncbi:HNH endonuclease signature motif containing protein [Pseudonocardia sp. MH-G8]|uniref:HNH endonuclease signature motif containing protein n=1 Tax=Pseudonocardia sp. MH-G8 TaxID=1854588 RepID=UPI000BA11CF3|nr:HNH endonuclease signature motif containing protein [Pseudonocardia sp. MH-G8]OZM81019.1 hypothetical protein CFP66_16565 [Pseudonocardia sp. MH-G8]
MSAVLDLVDRAVTTPPGPQLSALLHALPWGSVPNSRVPELLQAHLRQRSHEDAELLAGLNQLSHTVPIGGLPVSARAEAVARSVEHHEWAGHEIAAALTWTPTAAERELGFATALTERLPMVFTAFHQGRIDRGKAGVFVDYLDPDTGDVTVEQSRRLCERFLPLAPGLTAKQLADRIYRALYAIDPQFRRRRYRRAVQQRGVALFLDPATGTATVVGHGLPADEAAAAAARLDRLSDAAIRAGHPGRRSQISADLYLGMLNGLFDGLTEAQIIDLLRAGPRPEDNPDDDTDDDTDDPGDDDPGGPDDGGPDDDPDGGDPDDDPAGKAAVATIGATGDDVVIRTEAGGGGDDRPPDHSEPGRPAPPTGQPGSCRTGGPIGVREGIEIRLGLATLAGLDERPGEIPGLGPVCADLARDAVAAQRRGAVWRFAVVDATGHLLLAGPLRRRGRDHVRGRRAGAERVRGGVVELHVAVAELEAYASGPVLGEWQAVVAEIAARWADRDRLRGLLDAHPYARFARGPLAEHVRIRDRTCCGPGCTRSARRSDLDHTRDHGLGGRTVESNIGPQCKRHHPDKERGWALTQPGPGRFRWVSPLGRVYLTRGEPVRPDLPDPDPAPHPPQETAREIDQRLRRDGRRILRRPRAGPPGRPPPAPAHGPRPDDERPPF